MKKQKKSPVQKLKRNTKGRDFVVGDIHGCFHLLDQALLDVHFDPACDRVISVGDLINRGPESERCLSFLKQPWFFAVRGNHEQYFIDAYKKSKKPFTKKTVTADNVWLLSQNKKTIKSMFNKFKSLPFLIEIDTDIGSVGIVHADIPKKTSWKKMKKEIVQKNKKTQHTVTHGRSRLHHKITKKVAGIGRVFIGHTVQPHGIQKQGNCFYIDTGAVYHDKKDKKNKLSLTFIEIALPQKAYLQKSKHKKKNSKCLLDATKSC